MEKEFVPYEPSLRLKALEFDEKCLAYHRDNELYQEAGVCYVNSDFEPTMVWDEMLPNKNCTAPTFSQAFRWFREKHGLLSLTDHKTSHGWFYRVYFGDNEWYGGFVKYKEAELACLTKLIEIVEQQNQK